AYPHKWNLGACALRFAVKLVKGNPPRYALSKGFLMRNPGNDLYEVLRILKRLTQLTTG
ncbi:restriction endonuclease subunit R, partial [Scytonema sp. HK-05]